MKPHRLLRLWEVAGWPVVQLLAKIADRLLDNLLTLLTAILPMCFDILAVIAFHLGFVLAGWIRYWREGEHFRISHHRNFWHRHVKRKRP